MPADYRCMSLPEAGRCLGATRQNVHDWVELGCPCQRKGRRIYVDIAEVFRWKIERAIQTTRDQYRPQEEDPDDEDAPISEKERYLKARANLAELELAQKKSLLIEREGVMTTFRRAAEVTRQYFQTMGKKVAPKVAKTSSAAKCVKIITDEINDILKRLSEVRFGD